MPDEISNPTLTADELREAIRAELKAEFERDRSAVDSLIADELAAAPEQLRKLVPETLTPVEQVRWLRKAKASGAFASAAVAATDSQRPRNIAVPVTTATLTPIARIAAGYTNSQKEKV